MHKRLTLLVIAGLCLLLSTPAIADQIGLGGAYVDGHSDTGKYGINNGGDQSWGIVAHYDKDMGWKKQLSELHAVGIEPMLGLQYLRWTRNDNKEKLKCEFRKYDWLETANECKPEQSWCTTEAYEENHKVDTLIMSVGPKFYWEIKKFRAFASAGLGYALQDGAHDDLTAVFSGGIQYQITDHVGLSLTQWVDFVSPTGEYDRFDKTVFALEIFF